ncbi:Protein of unknown function [Gryllus bimaculatus]|nr:Protein of unknown function [Gryllus bimaculatus]
MAGTPESYENWQETFSANPMQCGLERAGLEQRDNPTRSEAGPSPATERHAPPFQRVIPSAKQLALSFQQIVRHVKGERKDPGEWLFGRHASSSGSVCADKAGRGAARAGRAGQGRLPGRQGRTAEGESLQSERLQRAAQRPHRARPRAARHPPQGVSPRAA